MMHSLLKRQILKYLPNRTETAGKMASFLSAIEQSYLDYDTKLSMLQRASQISSEELMEANLKLREEAQRQQQIINSLENHIVGLTKNLNQIQPEVSVDNNDANIENLVGRLSQLADHAVRLTEEQDRLVKDLETRNKSLNNYVHIMSHDLKSPIRNVSTLMNWILGAEKEKFSEASRSNCLLVAHNLEKMDKLISGILKHATVGETPEQPEYFESKDLLASVIAELHVPEQVTITVQPDMPKLLMEKERVAQIFNNLITNAITATGHLQNGQINVGYEPDNDFWKFFVKDNGKGIPEQYQKGIFEMFKKLEGDSSSAGIGLAIVKKIVDLYGGQIHLNSKENLGTTVSISLRKKV